MMPPRLFVAPVIFALCVIPVGCSPPRTLAGTAGAMASPLKVVTAVSVVEQVPRLVPLTGTVKASADSSVAANASGQVVQVFVERGSVVPRGAPLVQLDDRMPSLAAAEARANFESTRTQKAQADVECQRTQRLSDRHVITTQELERANLTCQAQQQSLAAAAVRHKQAVVTLGNTIVRAPFAGTVSERLVSVGEYVTPSTRVAELVQSDPVRLELIVGEGDATAVRVGQPVTFELKALPGRRFEATVRYVAPALRASTRDLVFEAVAPNPNGDLKPGMFATVWLEAGVEPAVVVPSSALRKDGDETRLFVVEGGHLQERLVQAGREIEGQTIVHDGVRAGERVVVDSPERPEDGRPVTE